MRKGILRIVIRNIMKSHNDHSLLQIALMAAAYLPADSIRRMDSIFEEVA